MEVHETHDPRHQSLRGMQAGIRPAAGLLAVLYSLLAVLRFVQAPAEVATALSATAAGIASLLAGVWWIQGHHPLPLDWAPHVAGAMGALVALNVTVNLLLTGDPLQTINVTLIVVGIGALVDHRHWAAGIIAAILGVWTGVAFRFPAPEWPALAVGLLSGCLLALVLRAVFLANMRSLECARQDAADQATTDELTGLLNRRGLEVVGEQALATARRMSLPIAMLFIDLDGMKAVNDNQGHLAGDARLVETGRRLTRVFRDADAVARVGGDEFAVLLVGTSGTDLEMMRDRASDVLEQASVGVAVADRAIGTSLVDLMHRADVEMYGDKASRRAVVGAGAPAGTREA